MTTVHQLMNLENKVALITGGAGHLGYSMAEALAQVGAHVVLLDCDMKKAEQCAETLKRDYRIKAMALTVDLTHDDRIKKIPEHIGSSLGGLDILIHSAALVGTSPLVGWKVPFEEQSLDTWRQALEVNLTAIFSLTQACYPLLRQSAQASVIALASMYGFVAPDYKLYEGTSMGNPGAYAASKGGVVQLVRWMSTTLAPKIRVNAISMGGVFRNHQEPFLSRYCQKTPLGRMAIEDDIKGAALYLASGLSAYVTGQNLVVDGGFTVW